LLIEVLSEDENRDRIEKFLMYQRIPSLEEYAVVSQRAEFPEVSVFANPRAGIRGTCTHRGK
jgi:Uma2 family endonuclease